MTRRAMRELRKWDLSGPLDVDSFASRPVFDELYAAIVSGAVDEPTGPIAAVAPLDDEPAPRQLRRPEVLRRRQRLVLAAAVVVLVAVTLTVALGASGPVGRTTTPWRAARVLPSGERLTSPHGQSGSWQLVSDLVSTGWQQNTSGPPPGALTCPATTACYALSGKYASASGNAPLLSESWYVSSDFGLSWSVLPMPSGFDPTTSLSCPDALDCAVAGAVKGKPVLVATSDGGHSWTVTRLHGLPGQIFDLSCSSATACHAIVAPLRSKGLLQRLRRRRTRFDLFASSVEPPGEAFVTTTDGGLDWTSRPLPPADEVHQFGCYDASDCMVMGERWTPAARVGSLTYRFEEIDDRLYSAINDDLQTANEVPEMPEYPLPAVLRPGFAALSKELASDATAVRQLPWSSSEQTEVDVLARACGSVERDLELDPLGKLTATRWKNDNNALNLALVGLASDLGVPFFPSGFFVRRTTDGGSTWLVGESSAGSVNSFDTLTCSSASDCAALGLTTSADPTECLGPDGGSPRGSNGCEWSPTEPLTQVSDLVITTDGGATWHKRTFPADVPDPLISGVACPTVQECWVAGTEAVQVANGTGGTNGSSPVLLGTSDSGVNWTKVTFSIPAGAPDYDGQSYIRIGSISCPSANACLALGVAAQGSPNTPVYRYLSGPHA